MFTVIRTSWPLLLGMFLLMLGNGMQGTVLGLRGGIEAFESTTMGFVMAGYFAGFLGGAQAAPWLVQRVGHVRVFAALASLISAAFIIFAAVVDPIAWTLMRFVVGFCFSGVYVVAESWLNDSSTNENRGRTLSTYLMTQMFGIIVAQGLINVADPGGYNLFVIMSVAVSISFAPMLLSASPAPVFSTTRRMSLGQLFKTSPLGCVGTFLLGAVFATQFGMGPVYATEIGLTKGEISIFIGAIYVGGLVLQYPIGWLSDRMDRRALIAIVTVLGSAGCLIALIFGGSFIALVVTAFLVGGTSNPLYSLLIAHTNDFLEHEDMASASGGLIVLNGIGAVGTPILVGYLMQEFGPPVFLYFIAIIMAVITAYALYRMTVRPAPSIEETSPIAPYSMVSGTQVAAEIAQEIAVEQASDSETQP
ncbi:MAG TPA: MFS transporter [Thermohalobaculum sp.]|nr:MFS transporter [Thermohalobaculum sp.]